MLKSIITRRANLSWDIDTCDYYSSETLPNGTKQFIGGKSYCFCSSGFFIIGAKFSIYADDGKHETVPVTNAFGAITSESRGQTCYKLVPEIDQVGKIYNFDQLFYSRETQLENFNVFLSLKKETKQTLSYKVEKTGENSKFISQTVLKFINPNGASISVENSKDAITYLGRDKIIKIQNKEEGVLTIIPSDFIVEGIYNEKNESFDFDLLEDRVYEASSEITIVGGSGTFFLPEKFFQIKPGTIYAMSTPDDEMPNFTGTGGVSNAVIAIIVIASIALVAVAAFCVYWFFFRNKSGGEVTPKV
jgi:hypothetical protein